MELNLDFRKIILLALFLLFGSCSDPLSEDESVLVLDQSNGVIQPLAVGNTWRYRVEVVNDNDVAPEQRSIETYSVDSISAYNNKNWFVFSESPEKWYLRNYDDGLYYYNCEKEQMLIKYPVEKGDTWSNEFKIIYAINRAGSIETDSATVTRQYEVLDDKVDIKIDNKTYEDCIEIKESQVFDNESFRSLQYSYRTLNYKEDIGMIRELQFGLDKEGNEILLRKKELIEHNLK